MTDLQQRVPYPNSTYTMNFFAPSYKCGNVSSQQQNVFDSSVGNWVFNHTEITYEFCPDCERFGNWPVYKSNTTSSPWDSDEDITGLYIWTDVANISCMPYNTSYKVDFRFKNGVQTTVLRSVEYVPLVAGDVFGLVGYGAWRDAFNNILLGSIVYHIGAGTPWLEYEDPRQNIQYTALMACPELIARDNGTSGFGVTDPLMCRDGSVTRAIEDLSRNITYSMLTSRDLT